MKRLMPRTKDQTPRTPWRRTMAFIVAAMVLLTLAELFLSHSVGAEETLPLAQRDGRMVLYVMDQPDLGLTDDMAQHIDQINYSFALIRHGEASSDHWQGAEQIQSYLRRHGHIDGVLAVGGWGADGFSQACATAEGRTKLVQSILSLMDEYGFTGVDIDWEYPGSSAAGIASSEEDVENWYLLLEELRQGLDQRQLEQGRDFLLSVALGAGEEQLNNVDGARLNKLVDQAVLMAYDLRGFDRITGHHAGLYPAGDVKASGAYAVNHLSESGLFTGKMLLGVPAYARVWRQVMGSGLNARAATAGNRTISYEELLTLEQQDYEKHFDEEAQAAWWFDGSTFVSGESAESLQAKADWLRDNGLLGAAVWAQHQDPEGMLIATLSAALTETDDPALATPTDLPEDTP